MRYLDDFENGLKIHDDLNNHSHGPHWDIMTDLRQEIGGIEKTRVTPLGDVIGGETVVGAERLGW